MQKTQYPRRPAQITTEVHQPIPVDPRIKACADIGARSLLVGYTGFVGSNLHRQMQFQGLYNSKNIAEIRGQSCDLLVFSGARAEKWRANLDPTHDLAEIDAAWDSVRCVEARHVVLVSTVDVFAEPVGVDELSDPAARANHAYGRNRFLLEERFRKHFPSLTIVRLPGLFGSGLKKNVIFDLMNRSNLGRINPESTFQYYSMSRFGADLARIIHARIPLVHLATEPISTAEIQARFFADRRIGSDPAPVASYDLRTRHAALFDAAAPYIQARDAVLRDLESFVAVESA